MSIEADSKNIANNLTDYVEDELKVGEALAHILAAASIVIDLDGESDDIRDTVRRYVDLWISKISPIDYSPGMAEVVGSKIKTNITKIFRNINEDELGKILDSVVDIKRKLDHNVIDSVNIIELEANAEKIFRALGIDLNDVRMFFNFIDVEKRANRLISLLAVAIGISALWDEKWIVGSQ